MLNEVEIFIESFKKRYIFVNNIICNELKNLTNILCDFYSNSLNNNEIMILLTNYFDMIYDYHNHQIYAVDITHFNSMIEDEIEFNRNDLTKTNEEKIKIYIQNLINEFE
jgi:hypothetical protein